MTLERLDIHTCEDRLQVALHRARYDFALEQLRPSDAVLEIGTGLGVFTEEICRKCASYTGVEYEEASWRATVERTRANVIRGDARRLPFPDNQFSYIVCLEVLEHLGDWRAGVAELHRCLRPDGRAVVSVPWRRRGGKSAINEYHLYEPGEHELRGAFEALFGEVKVLYQYFPETRWMTLARTLRLRRLAGLAGRYKALADGLPSATGELRIGPVGRGMKSGLILVPAKKKVCG